MVRVAKDGLRQVKIPKPTSADRHRFAALVPDATGVEVEPMCHMSVGLFGADVGVKLPDQRARPLARPGAGPFGPQERPTGGYVTLPAGWTARKAAPWTVLAVTTAVALPPRARKKRAADKNAAS